jgi:hypothetical protein
LRLLAPCACVRFRLLGALALCHVCLAYQISRISKQSCLGSAPSLSFLFALLLNSIEIQNTSIVKARFLIEILEKWNGRGKKPKMDDHHSSCLRLACVDLSRRHQEPTKLSQRFTLPHYISNHHRSTNQHNGCRRRNNQPRKYIYHYLTL